MKTTRITRIIIVTSLLIVGATIVTAFVFGIAKKLNIPLGNDRLSVKLERGDVRPEETITSNDDANPKVRARQIRMIYTLNDEKISGIYLEILNSPKKEVHFLEIPKSTKVSLSDELYKELVAYSPTLPQYVKVSKLDSHFSKTFRYEGMTKIFAETLNEPVDSWIAISEEVFRMWLKKGYDVAQNSQDAFFNVFDTMISTGESSLDASESRMYYEIYRGCSFTDDGVVNGEWDKTDYVISTIAAKELIEELKY